MLSNKNVFSMLVGLSVMLLAPNFSFARNYSSMAMPEQISVGAFYGGTLGASATYMLTRETGLDAAVAMELGGDQNIHAWADYLWRMNNAFELMDYPIGLYYGGGAKFRTENNPNVESAYMVGPRVVAGLIHEVSSMSLEFFGETAFTKHLMGGSKTEFDIAVGARYYF